MRDQRLGELNPTQTVFLIQISFLLLAERTQIKRSDCVPTIVRTSKSGWVSLWEIS